MTKIRCTKDIAIDLNQVVAWKKLKMLNSPEGTEILKLFIAGVNSDFSVASSAIGRPAFDRLHKLLLDRFAIDLVKEDDNSVDEPLELPF